MASNRDQLDLGLGEGFLQRKGKDGRSEWLRAFYARAYARGKEAGVREVEERMRAEIAALFADAG